MAGLISVGGSTRAWQSMALEYLGHVWAHACEGKCRRGDVNEPVSIRNIKRYAAETAGVHLEIEKDAMVNKTAHKGN